MGEEHPEDPDRLARAPARGFTWEWQNPKRHRQRPQAGTTMELLTIICVHVFPLHILVHIWSNSAANRTTWIAQAFMVTE